MTIFIPKQIPFLVILPFALIACSQTTDIEDLERRDGLYYETGKDEPFTGNIDSSYSGSDIYGRSYNGVVIARGKIENGKKQGLWKEWYARGVPFYEGNYINGLAQGTHNWWHPNGEMLVAGPYVDGMRHGSYKKWYENGGKNQQLQYEMDELHGDQYQWDMNGNLTMHEVYENGKLICSVVFDTLGQVKSRKGNCQ